MRSLRIYLPLATLLALTWWVLYRRLALPDAWDAVNMYIPMAKQLLARGPAYFADEASIQMAPFTYIWPALFGANLAVVKMANVALAGVTLVLLFRTGWLLHSEVAGLAAAAAFVACPAVGLFVPTGLSEPPFFLLSALWLWSLAEFEASNNRRWLFVTALSLGLASITRGSLFYLLPLLVIYFAGKRDRDLALAHLAALAIPAAFIVKNLVLFGFGFFATGSGNALYLGAHPITGGYDPYYFGIFFDVGSVTQGPSPLTLESERLLAGIGKMMIFQGDPAHLASLYAHKLAAFLFISNLVQEDNVMVLRAWRTVAFILSAIGFMAVRSTLLRAVIGLTLFYQVVVHIPVLYNYRYSAGSIDLWLVLLSGIGIAAMIERRDGTFAGRMALVAALGLAAGWWQYRYGAEPQLDLSRTRSPVVWETRNLHGYGDLEVPVPASAQFPKWANFALAMDGAAGCASIRISYRREGETQFSAPVTHRLNDDGRIHRYRWGAMMPLEMTAPGRLRIEAPCMMEISRLAIHTLEAGPDLRERYLK